MLFLLSPAKSLDYETPANHLPHTQPLFIAQSEPLIKALRKKSWRQIGKLMDLSQNLAELNVARYAAWTPDFTLQNSKQAVLAFDGDVYDGLQAKTLSAGDLDWAQAHLCILSGLYGVLRPLDLMQAYRLEMGTALKVGRADNLVQFWGDRVSLYLNERLQNDTVPTVVNLASVEYFRAVKIKALNARVVDCVFEDFKNGEFKVISFFAKKARGALARFAIENRIDNVLAVQQFNRDGYAFAPEVSDVDRLVFRRTAVD